MEIALLLLASAIFFLLLQGETDAQATKRKRIVYGAWLLSGFGYIGTFTLFISTTIQKPSLESIIFSVAAVHCWLSFFVLSRCWVFQLKAPRYWIVSAVVAPSLAIGMLGVLGFLVGGVAVILCFPAVLLGIHAFLSQLGDSKAIADSPNE